MLDRKHLPPLSLKDFEEWLLFIEQCPENLYFVLWLREYTQKYNQWAAKLAKERAATQKRTVRFGSSSKEKDEKDAERLHVTWRSSTTAFSPSLALSVERARHTFFVPGAPYELFVPPEILPTGFLGESRFELYFHLSFPSL